MEYIIKKASIKDKNEITKLYKSLIGQDGCTWNDEYPNNKIIEQDIRKKELFCIKNKNDIIAIATLTKDIEIEKEISKSHNPYLLTRVAVNKKYQGQGYSKILLQQIFESAIKEKIDLIYLLVNKENIRAKKLYEKFDFKFRKNIKLYEIKWELLEKNIYNNNRK